MDTANEQREQDRKRLEACDRLQRAKIAGDEAKARAEAACEHALRLEQEQNKAWQHYHSVESEFYRIVHNLPRKVPEFGFVAAAGAEAPACDGADAVKCAGPVEPAPPAAMPLSPQETEVFCVAYRAAFPGGCSSAACKAATEAVEVYRALGKAPAA